MKTRNAYLASDTRGLAQKIPVYPPSALLSWFSIRDVWLFPKNKNSAKRKRLWHHSQHSASYSGAAEGPIENKVFQKCCNQYYKNASLGIESSLKKMNSNLLQDYHFFSKLLAVFLSYLVCMYVYVCIYLYFILK